MNIDKPSTVSERPAACFACHAIGISSSTILGIYLFYQAKKAKTSAHRFTCALFGLGSFIFASHRISSVFKDISQYRIAANGRLKSNLNR